MSIKSPPPTSPHAFLSRLILRDKDAINETKTKARNQTCECLNWHLRNFVAGRVVLGGLAGHLV